MKRIASILIAVVMLTVCVVGVATNAFADQTPAEATYKLTSSLKNGDKVIVYNPESGVAMSQEGLSDTNADYRKGVQVAVVDGKIATADATIVWTANVTGTNVEFVSADGKKLSCATDGKLPLGDTDTVWGISDATTEGCVYLTSTTVKGSKGDYRSIEWYKDQTKFSSFFYKDSMEGLFALQLFALEESAGNTSSEATSDASTEASSDTSSTTEPAGPDLGPVNANAAFGLTVNATVEGNTATVKIGVKDVTIDDISIFRLNLCYDADKVEPVVKNNPDDLNAAMQAFLTKKPGADWNDALCSLNETEGYYSLSYMSISAATGLDDGNAEITVTFTVKEGAEGDLNFYVPHASVSGAHGDKAAPVECKGNGAIATVALSTGDESSTDTSSAASSEASSAASSDTTSEGGTPVTGDAGVVAVVILAVVAAFGSAVVVKSRR